MDYDGANLGHHGFHFGTAFDIKNWPLDWSLCKIGVGPREIKLNKLKKSTSDPRGSTVNLAP